MIVWINGPFGAGKSTLATGLREALAGSVVADPEDVGSLLRKSMAGHALRVRDYQDYPAWRRLTVQLIIELYQLTGGTVIVPMTVLKRAYADEILRPLRELSTEVHHLVLHADPRQLEARIAASQEYPDGARSEAVRSHRRRRAHDYEQAAAEWLHDAGHVIDTNALTPKQTLQAALAHPYSR
ncbi:ATP-binding protein [Streptomyces goshikiensis]|uniref:AAA family ATPase n=1 Tax=Streptomyces TaxID=1883 RepID=UPI002E2B760F|nr:AAA family ATPase [Streptomyces sp. NBC_00239]WSX97023.1 ATP-binding protein [Streptomyces goshikiensis]